MANAVPLEKGFRHGLFPLSRAARFIHSRSYASPMRISLDTDESVLRSVRFGSEHLHARSSLWHPDNMSDNDDSSEQEPTSRDDFDSSMLAIKKDLNRLEDTAQEGLAVGKKALRIAERGLRTADRSLRVAQAILKTVQSIEGRLKAMDDHGERLVRLENEVFAGNRPHFKPPA